MVDIHHLMQHAPISLDDYRRQRKVGDFYQRARLSSLFFVVAMLIVAWMGGYFSRFPWAMGMLCAVFVVFWYTRRAHRPPQDVENLAATQTWWWSHWALVHATCLTWCGFLIFAGYMERAVNDTFFVAAAATIAFSLAGCENYATNRRQATLVVLFLQLPAALVFLWDVPVLRAYALVMAIMFAYQLIHIRGRAAEYDVQIEIEYALLKSRAEVERLSRRDALTGLPNRREYESAFHAQWNQAARQRSPFALIVMDLDYFKRVNDTLGHAAGDAALIHVARLMEQQFRRAGDTIARIGGEEFVVVMPDTTAEEALRLAREFQEILALTPLEYNQQQIALTASLGVGVADWDQDTTPQNTFSRIDAACYAAKTRGRNHVIQA